jgi:hypothetical protein
MLMTEIDRNLGETLGVNYRWSEYIEKCVKSRSYSTVDLVDDYVATTITNLCLDRSKLEKSIKKAHENSENEAEFLNNLKGVVSVYVKYSVKKERRRWTNGTKVPQLSQFEHQIDPEYTPRNDYEQLISDLEETIINRLKNDPKNRGRLAARYQLAIQIVPDRIRGFKIDDLMKLHNASKISVHRALELIQKKCPLN